MATAAFVAPGSVSFVLPKQGSLAEDLADAGVVTYPMERVRAYKRMVVRGFRRESGRWRYVWPLAWLHVRYIGGWTFGIRGLVLKCVNKMLCSFPGGEENVGDFQKAGAQWQRLPHRTFRNRSAVPQGIEGTLFRASQAAPDARVFVDALYADPFVTLERRRNGCVEEVCVGYWNAPGFMGIMDPGNSA